MDDEGRRELQRYLVKVLMSLCKREQRRQMEPLSITYIVRFDVGILPHSGTFNGNEACYFVNEVTRAPDMTWWEHGDGGAQRLSRFYIPIECALLDMVKWHREVYS
jgi:hypothetical protein